jgi:uncharacterized phage protein gp47/JayE
MNSIYRTREDILASMLSQLVGAIPDVYTGEDGVIRIIFDIEAGQFESLYLSLQLLLEDMFVSTASYTALSRHGEQYGLPMQIGTQASGTLMFSGESGTFIPLGTLVSYDPGNGVEPVPFSTMADATIPDTGVPQPPGVVKTDGGGNLTGGYEYVVTFLTAQGETLPSQESQIVVVTAGHTDINSISIGGPGTMGRRLYRDVNGLGNYRLVHEFPDNTSTTYTDNASDASLANAQTPTTVDTAHRVPAQGIAVNPGIDGNMVVGAITTISDGPATLTSVTNITAFTGGSDPEDSEIYRRRLLSFIQNPQTGSVADIEAWALNVPGVETATVFENTPVNGTVTVRVTGPNGSIATPETIAAVQQLLDQQDYANITIVVSSFTALPTDITVNVTEAPGYTLAIVTPSVQQAISDYITSLGTGETLYVAGIIDATFGLAGVADVVVTTPSSNQTTAAGSKRTTGTITVT